MKQSDDEQNGYRGMKKWQIYKGRVNFQDTKFKRPIPEEQQDQLFTQEVRNMFKSKEWKINITTNSSSLSTNKWIRVLSIVKQCPAQKLILSSLPIILDNNVWSTIIREISQIKFVNMKYLQLKMNIISNIQALTKLNAPLLEKLDLSQNKITKVTPLRKSYFKCLKSLSLFSNFIKDFSALTQMKSAKLFINYNIQENMFNYTGTGMKLEQLNLQPGSLKYSLEHCYVQHCLQPDLTCRTTIHQIQLVTMIKKRFPGIDVQTWKTSEESDQDESNEEDEEDD